MPVESHRSHIEKEMPKYECHKVVHALQIAAISKPITGSGFLISWSDPTYSPVAFESAWCDRHEPKIGGYVVHYADGYVSFSPSEAFESGYTRID